MTCKYRHKCISVADASTIVSHNTCMCTRHLYLRTLYIKPDKVSLLFTCSTEYSEHGLLVITVNMPAQYTVTCTYPYDNAALLV